MVFCLAKENQNKKQNSNEWIFNLALMQDKTLVPNWRSTHWITYCRDETIRNKNTNESLKGFHFFVFILFSSF